MLRKTAFQIVRHENRKYVGAVIGVGMALLLMLLQIGFFLGYRRDITVVADAFEADLWITQRHCLAFDYVVHIDDTPQYQVLSDGDVAAAMAVIADWTRLRRRSSGATENGYIVGLDFSSGVPMHLGVTISPSLVSQLSVPGNVIIGENYFDRVGVSRFGESGVEFRGLNANVVGIARGKQLFTTACLTITDLDNARRFLGLNANQISFVAAKCRAGANVRGVQQRLQSRLPEYRVWTASEFRALTQNYWVRLTGIGPVLLLSAALAMVVGFLTVFLTFSHLTSEKLPMYAAMKAIGASTAELSGLVMLQIAVVFGLGSAGALAGVLLALVALAGTTISVDLPPRVIALGVGFMALCSAAAGLRSVQKLAKVEPAEAFRT